MKKLLAIALFVILGVAKCNAQYEDVSWLHNELWEDSDGGPIIGPIYDAKYYFSEDGRFYEAYSRRARRSFSFIQEAYSGRYEYEPENRKIILYTDNIDSARVINIFIDDIADNTIKIKFDKAAKGNVWNRSKNECTFAMTSNSVIFAATTVTVCPDINDCYDANKLKVDENEKREVLNILRKASHSKHNPDWIDKADYILSVNDDNGSYARILFQKDNSQIYVDASGWISGAAQSYVVSDPELTRLLEITKKYIHNQN